MSELPECAECSALRKALKDLFYAGQYVRTTKGEGRDRYNAAWDAALKALQERAERQR